MNYYSNCLEHVQINMVKIMESVHGVQGRLHKDNVTIALRFPGGNE